MKDREMFKLGAGNDIWIMGCPRSGMVWGLKGQRSRLGLGLGLTAIRRGFECLLVGINIRHSFLIFANSFSSKCQILKHVKS